MRKPVTDMNNLSSVLLMDVMPIGNVFRQVEFRLGPAVCGRRIGIRFALNVRQCRDHQPRFPDSGIFPETPVPSARKRRWVSSALDPSRRRQASFQPENPAELLPALAGVQSSWISTMMRPSIIPRSSDFAGTASLSTPRVVCTGLLRFEKCNSAPDR